MAGRSSGGCKPNRPLHGDLRGRRRQDPGPLGAARPRRGLATVDGGHADETSRVTDGREPIRTPTGNWVAGGPLASRVPIGGTTPCCRRRGAAGPPRAEGAYLARGLCSIGDQPRGGGSALEGPRAFPTSRRTSGPIPPRTYARCISRPRASNGFEAIAVAPRFDAIVREARMVSSHMTRIAEIEIESMTEVSALELRERVLAEGVGAGAGALGAGLGAPLRVPAPARGGTPTLDKH